MKSARPDIDMSKVTPTTPLRLEIAAAVGFPDGTMSVSGLRKERDRGTLRVMKIAGKEYTTLAAIEAMLELCYKPPAAYPGSRDSSATAQKRRVMAAPLQITPQEALQARLDRMAVAFPPSKRKLNREAKSGDK